MSESAPVVPINDQSVELREKLKLTPYGVPQPELKEIPPPEKPADLPQKVEKMLNKPSVTKPSVIEK